MPGPRLARVHLSALFFSLAHVSDDTEIGMGKRLTTGSSLIGRGVESS
jgi:hypothetical protein